MIQKLKAESPIDEIHRVRREISERFGGDISAIADDAAQRLATSGRPIWQPKRTNKTNKGPDISNRRSLAAGRFM